MPIAHIPKADMDGGDDNIFFTAFSFAVVRVDSFNDQIFLICILGIYVS